MKLYKNLNIQAVKGGNAVYNGENRLTVAMKHIEALPVKARLSKIQKFR